MQKFDVYSALLAETTIYFWLLFSPRVSIFSHPWVLFSLPPFFNSFPPKAIILPWASIQQGRVLVPPNLTFNTSLLVAHQSRVFFFLLLGNMWVNCLLIRADSWAVSTIFGKATISVNLAQFTPLQYSIWKYDFVATKPNRNSPLRWNSIGCDFKVYMCKAFTLYFTGD